MRVRVGYHGRCFDGCTSAVLFTRLYRAIGQKNAQIEFRALAHQKGHVPGTAELDGDENAILDFKYTTSPALTWWFDHHQSAFANAEDRAHFDADRSGRKFYDPACTSCTKLITAVAQEKFGIRWEDLAELVRWADIIDSARFESPGVAVELLEPALQLMTVIEVSDDAFCTSLIPRLDAGGLAVASAPDVRARFEPIQREHLEAVKRVRQRARCEGEVVHFDLTEWNMDGFNKFIGYYLFPDAAYSVGVTASARRAKVSVGSNPWSPHKRRHDISRLCEKYGGGGHPAVGAVTLPGSDVAEARRVGLEIARTLRDA
ncbi:MAG: phosphoesterase [Deltaproteobacteria bacterium]|nr:phosphoesterase [Deltaproteobacteria bacterium]